MNVINRPGFDSGGRYVTCLVVKIHVQSLQRKSSSSSRKIVFITIRSSVLSVIVYDKTKAILRVFAPVQGTRLSGRTPTFCVLVCVGLVKCTLTWISLDATRVPLSSCCTDD